MVSDLIHVQLFSLSDSSGLVKNVIMANDTSSSVDADIEKKDYMDTCMFFQLNMIVLMLMIY